MTDQEFIEYTQRKLKLQNGSGVVYNNPQKGTNYIHSLTINEYNLCMDSGILPELYSIRVE